MVDRLNRPDSGLEKVVHGFNLDWRRVGPAGGSRGVGVLAQSRCAGPLGVVCGGLLRLRWREKRTFRQRQGLAEGGTAGPERARPETCRSFGLQ
jgi:hypothetical protein